MQIGAVLPHNEIGTDPGAIAAYARGLEELGVTHLLVYDHVLGADRERPGGFAGPYDKDVAFHEPFGILSFIAALTTNVELVTTVLILPQRQTVLVAKQAAEVAVLSAGRFRLGVGTGWNEIEYVGLNESFDDRGRRMTEQVELLRRLWDEDAFTFDGEFHTIDAAGINPRPATPIPIWFGGSAPVALRRCARLGDGWIPLGSPNDASRACLETIRAEREAAGRTMDDFGVQAQAQYAGGDPDRWRSHAARWAELGATHLAIATHNAGPTDADGHLARIAEYLAAVRD
ncbi:MAG: LLM class F420-dependent oxidoreductase [Ilumatobacteraceae bacterium]